MVGYRDDKESFLVDFEKKRWDQERLQHTGSAGAAGDGARDTDTPEAIVRRHQGVDLITSAHTTSTHKPSPV